MNINKTIAAILIAGTMLLSGCSKQELPSDIPINSSSQSEISDPMEEPVESGPEKLPSSAYGFHFDKENVSLSDDGLVVSPKIKCGKSGTNIGISVFIDGIQQKYSIGDSSEKSNLTPVNIEGNSEKTFDLKIDGAIDGNLDEHYILVTTMLAPGFVSSPQSPFFGHNHKTLCAAPVIADEEIKNKLPSEKYKILKADNSVLTQKQIEKYKIVKDSEKDIVEAVYLLQSDNRLEDRHVLPEGENKITLKFASFTTRKTVEKHRATFYVNHKPVKFNGGYDCLDFTQEGEKITEMEIELENVKPGDFVYCIDVPFTADGYTYKSRSTLIVTDDNSPVNNPGGTSENPSPDNSDNSQNSDTSNNSQSSDIPDSPQTSDNPENSQSPAPQTSSDKVKSVEFNGRIIPRFSIDGYIYATESKQDAALLKLDSNGNIVKKLADGSNFKLHGDKITKITSSPSPDGNGEIETLTLLDEDFNEVKKLSISDDGTKYGYDFDEKRIAYIYLNDDNSAELRVCDWNFTNQKTLMSIPAGSSFGQIVLTDSCVAFRLTDSGQYYGICDFTGKSQKYSKENMSSKVQAAENSVFWWNKHGEPAANGEVVQYINGNFKKIKTQIPTETQDIFPTAANEFFTTPYDKNILRQYKNGVKCGDISLEKGESVTSVVRAGNKIVVGIMTEEENRLKIWELN